MFTFRLYKFYVWLSCLWSDPAKWLHSSYVFGDINELFPTSTIIRVVYLADLLLIPLFNFFFRRCHSILKLWRELKALLVLLCQVGTSCCIIYLYFFLHTYIICITNLKITFTMFPCFEFVVHSNFEWLESSGF